MAAELMEDQATPMMRAELRRNVAELDQLIDEILLASRLDAVGAPTLCVDEVDLTGILAEECARAGATLNAGMHIVRGDSRLLRRMVRNLLDNAIRYGAGAPVAVRLAAAGKAALQLDVCDGGPGIRAAERERIFEPFYRVPGASEAAGGVGLGLSLVRQIPRRHGGEVHCLPGAAGGRLRVTLPR